MASVKIVAKKSKTRNSAKSSISVSIDVDEFMEELNHPLKEMIERLRHIILSTNKGITEHIKWKALSFVYEGDDKITFNLHKDTLVMIVFHRGAKVKELKGTETLFRDSSGLLEWLAPDRAVAKLKNLSELKTKEEAFKKIVKKWLASSK